jgi:hypothetical protein
MNTIKDFYTIIFISLIILPIPCILGKLDYCWADLKEVELQFDIDDPAPYHRRNPLRLCYT